MNVIDWSEVGALASVAGVMLVVLGYLVKWLVGEIRVTQTVADENKAALATINRRVTTPDRVPGTLGETVADLSVNAEQHFATDDERFGRLWQELGKVEPELLEGRTVVKEEPTP